MEATDRLARDHALAIDLGTGGPKVGLVSLRGDLTWLGFRPVATRHLDDGGAVQDADEWWRAVVDLTTEALGSGAVDATDVVAIAVTGKGPVSLDAGRCAQNMLLAAWDQGVGGSPNGTPDGDALAALLGLGEGERSAIVLTFGYPAKPRDPSSRPPEDWSARANRKPLDELVARL